MDPGGYGCDLLRSCYKTKMVFTTGGVPYDVRWYFTKKDTKPLDIPNTFNSRNWTFQDSPWPEIGEVQFEDRVYDKGKPPKQMPTYKRIGTDSDYAIGQAMAEPSIEVNPACDIIYPDQLPSGIELGGEAREVHGRWVTAGCPLGTPRVMRLWFRAFADPNPALPLFCDIGWSLIFGLLFTDPIDDGSDIYGFLLQWHAAASRFKIFYQVNGSTAVSQDQLNVPQCSPFRALWSPIHLDPATPDPFMNYLYDVWCVPLDEPQPW